MTQAKIRQLTAEELPEMRALNALFARCFDDPASYAEKKPDDAYLRALLAKPHVLVMTAHMNGVLCGGLVAYQLEKFEQARSEIYIYDLAVDAEFRRQGIATALIAKISEVAVARGAWVSFVQADYADAPALALYEKLGIREEVLHFDIPPMGKPAGQRS